MPNENAPVCACGVVVDLPKSRTNSIVLGKLTILLPKSKGNKTEGKGSRKQQDDGRGPKSRTSSSETGSSSSEAARSTTKASKHEKRLNHLRRTRSADRAESHYTYIGRLEFCGFYEFRVRRRAARVTRCHVTLPLSSTSELRDKLAYSAEDSPRQDP
jgi:hypothetical protein